MGHQPVISQGLHVINLQQMPPAPQLGPVIPISINDQNVPKYNIYLI